MRKLATALAAITLAVTTAAPAQAGLPGFYRNKTVAGPRTVVFKYAGTNDFAVHIWIEWYWARRDRRPTPVHTYTYDLAPGFRVVNWAHQFSRHRHYRIQVYGYSAGFWHSYTARIVTGPIPTPRLAPCNTFTTGDGETWACWDGCAPPCVGGTS